MRVIPQQEITAPLDRPCEMGSVTINHAYLTDSEDHLKRKWIPEVLEIQLGSVTVKMSVWEWLQLCATVSSVLSTDIKAVTNQATSR
jgi:hypothetical protein